MQNDDLVPEGSFGVDSSYLRNSQVERRQIVINIGLNRYFAVRIKGGFGARLDLNRGADIIRLRRRRRILDQKRLLVGICVVYFHPCRACIKTGGL